MKAYEKKDITFLKGLMAMPELKLKNYLIKMLKRWYPEDKIKIAEQYIFAEGTTPIALAAHMDTVFAKPPTKFYYDAEQNTMWSPHGLGADDRAGIFAIIKILKEQEYLPTVIFTLGEELGGVGASALISDIPSLPTDLKYIVQLDRRGTRDCVFYDCDNPDFITYIESFGFTENFGSFTDISIICPVWGVAGVNLSVGYWDEHTNQETLNVLALKLTILKVKKMLRASENALHYKYIPLVAYNMGVPYDDFNLADYMGYSAAWSYGLQEQCICCGKKDNEINMMPITINDKVKYYCVDCCAEKINWCDSCGEPYRREDGHHCTKKISSIAKEVLV